MQYPVSISLIFGLKDRPGDFTSLQDSVFLKWYDQICVPRCVPISLRLRYQISSRAARTRTIPSSKALLQMSYVTYMICDLENIQCSFILHFHYHILRYWSFGSSELIDELMRFHNTFATNNTTYDSFFMNSKLWN